VLVWISLAIARRKYQRIGPEPAILERLEQLRSYYEGQEIATADLDKTLLNDVRQLLIESYSATTPANRTLNQQRYRHRARASMHLVRSLIWALLATSVIFAADKLGFLPRINP
jgi:hypothetical protein